MCVRARACAVYGNDLARTADFGCVSLVKSHFILLFEGQCNCYDTPPLPHFARAHARARTHALRGALSIRIDALEERFKEIVMVNPSPLLPHLFFPRQMNNSFLLIPSKILTCPHSPFKGD